MKLVGRFRLRLLSKDQEGLTVEKKNKDNPFNPLNQWVIYLIMYEKSLILGLWI